MNKSQVQIKNEVMPIITETTDATQVKSQTAAPIPRPNYSFFKKDYKNLGLDKNFSKH